MNRTLGIERVTGFIKTCLPIFATVLLTAATGFAGGESQDQPDWDKARWRQELLEYRKARTEKMATSRTSMLAAVTQVMHTGSETLYFDAAPTGFNYSETKNPDSKVAMMLSGDYWEWRALDTTVSVTFRGKPMEPGRLEPGMVFDIAGRYTYMIWVGLAGDLQFAIFDNERPVQKNFKGLVEYSPDERFRVTAGFERFEELKTIKMLTNITGTRDFFRYGEVRFDIGGQPQRLTAYKEFLNNPRLFIPFRDETSGKATYGAGRFIVIDDTEADTIIIDFNRARNLPCAYSPEFNCPIPPRENWMQVSVAAGEQTFPLPD